jgi:hypothetical protein
VVMRAMVWSKDSSRHVCAEVISGIGEGTGGNEPVGGIPDIEDARCLLWGSVCWV